MLIIHIAIALCSVALATHFYFVPSRTKLRLSMGLVACTVASGTYLVIASQAVMFRTCMIGLLYVGVVTIIIIAARNKLVAQEQQRKAK